MGDRSSMPGFNDQVINRVDRHALRIVPVARSEHEGGGRGGQLRIGTHGDGDVRSRLTLEHQLIGVTATTLSHQRAATTLGEGDANGIVVLVGRTQVRGILAIVETIKTGGRLEVDRESDVAVGNVIIHTSDRDNLIDIPVARRERHRRRRHGAFARIETDNCEADIGKRLTVQANREGVRTTRLGGHQAGQRTDHETHGIVVIIGQLHVGGWDTVITGIKGHQRRLHHVDDVAIIDKVIDTIDRDNLRRAPVAAIEDQRVGARINHAFRTVGTGESQGHILHRLRGEINGEGSTATSLSGHQPAGRRDDDTRDIIISIRHRHICRIETVVFAIGGTGRVGKDRVADRAIIEKVIDTGHGDALGGAPIARGEGHRTW